MRAALALMAISCCILALPVQASAKFHYTHSVTVTGSIVDNWTISNPDTCASVGAGTVSVDFQTKGSTRIRPLIDRVAGRPHSRKAGSWVLAVPEGGGITHMGTRKATG